MHPQRTLLTGSPYCVLVLENGGARHRVRGCDCHRLFCIALILNRSTTEAQKPITRGAARIGQIAALSPDGIMLERELNQNGLGQAGGHPIPRHPWPPSP